MKIKLLTILFCVSTILSAKNYTDFSQKVKSNSTTLSTIETQNLASLCKVWGFLKYYHPNVAKGKFNWDEQFLSILPKVKQASTKEELSKIYLDWIESLGEIKACKSCGNGSKKEYFDKNFDLSWTQNSAVFSDELIKKLKFIENNRFQGENYYVTTKSSKNIQVKNEPKYPNAEFPDQNLRLLSLSRYWNVVEYFFPYKYQTDQNWNAVLIEMIPRFFDAEDVTQYHLTLLETVVKLDDSHATLYTNPLSDFFGRLYLPVHANLIDNKLVVDYIYNDSLAKANDLKIGDVIEKVDGVEVSKIINKANKYNVGSNESVKAKHRGSFILEGKTDFIELTIKRGDAEFEKKCGRFESKHFKYNPQNREKYKVLDQNIAYVNMEFLEMKDVDKMMEELKSTKVMIIDYRGKFMNFTPFFIARRLIQDKKEFAKFLLPDLSYPGKFYWDESETITPIKTNAYTGKVIVLVNEEAQSSSEYATMLLQAGNDVTTIGSQTSGADGNVSKIDFLGYETLMSGIGVFYPDGTETQRKGVRVDIKVRPTIKGMQEGRDEVLEKALEFAKN